MHRAVLLLAIALLAGAIEDVAGQEIEIVASADTVVLKVNIEPQRDFNDQAFFDLAYTMQGTRREVAEADRIVDEMVRKSFEGGSINDEHNKEAVQLRRDWALFVDNILQEFGDTAKITLMVEFPESPEKEELLKHGDWPTVKKELAGADNDKMMLGLLQYRRRLTDALLSVAWLRMRQDPPRATDSRMDFFETEPVGSVTRTSDLDVTTVGYNCAAAVKYFNDYFRGGFCAESGIVLDSNVYCEIYKVHSAVPAVIGDVRDKPDDNPACQDAMALTKLRRYATPAEWDMFAKSTSQVPTVARADSFFKYYEKHLQQPPAISMGAQCTTESGRQLAGHAAKENEEMAAANELYARWLERLRKSLWANASADQLKFEQSAANLFANESYNSQGPLLHVLGIVQGKRIDLIESITKEQLLNSVNEQIGDALKDLTHYEHVNPDNIGEAIYKSSKYIDRALQAVWMMEAKDGSIDLRPGSDERSPTLLETLFQKPDYDVEELLRIRAGEDGQERVYRPDGVRDVPRLKKYKSLTAEQKAQKARKATTIKTYRELRDKLIVAVIDINLRARPRADTQATQRCEFALH